MKRALTLRSETLADLTAAELGGVVGAALPTTPVKVCVDETFDSVLVCYSWACPTEG